MLWTPPDFKSPRQTVAVARIDRLKAELTELRKRHEDDILSVRSLALALETALSELDQAHQ